MKELKIQYSRNFLLQLVSDDQDEISTPDEVKVSWGNAIEINIENQNHAGLRLPQFGAICAIRAHWTVSQEPATIVMPTGERVIIVMGALNVILSRVSRTLTKYYSYIA